MNLLGIPIVVCQHMNNPNVAVICNRQIFAADGLVSRLKEHPESIDEILGEVAIIRLDDYDAMKWPDPPWLKAGYVPVAERPVASRFR